MFPECSLNGMQAVWNATDGFTLTDPVIHHASKSGRHKHTNGATDKGVEGIRSFLKTHECNDLCRRLGLDPYDGPVVGHVTKIEPPPQK